MGHGLLFVVGAIYAWTNPAPGQSLLGFAVLLAVGLLEFGYALTWLLRVDSLVVDLDRRAYRVRRGAFRRETISGPLKDFDRLRLRDLPYGRGNRGRRWVVERIWQDPSQPPFQVTSWGQPRPSDSLSASRGAPGSLTIRHWKISRSWPGSPWNSGVLIAAQSPPQAIVRPRIRGRFGGGWPIFQKRGHCRPIWTVAPRAG